MPSPYTRDLFAAVAADGRMESSVFYLEMSAPDTHWDHVELPPYARVLSGRWLNFLGGRVHFNPGALRQVLQCNPDVVVIGGYSSITSQRLMIGLSKARIPWVFWGEVPGMRPKGVLRRILRSVAMRPVIRRASGVAAIGTVAQQAYRQVVEDRCPVANIPYCCDMNMFQSTLKYTRNEDSVRYLYCGQLIQRKGVDLLIKAFCHLAKDHPNVSLDLVGTGPFEDELRRMIPADISRQVRFHGFRPVAELPGYFRNADVFVLPSRHDGWGVVVNQALASGLAIICTDAVGAAKDLVIENHNGHVVTAGDVDALSAAMRTFVVDPSKISSFGSASKTMSDDWTPEKAVDRWWNMLSDVLERHRSTVRVG